jgi:hypothetical protein
MTMNVGDEYLFRTAQGSLIRRKILRHGADGFTSPQKEVVLWIVIDLKNPSSSVTDHQGRLCYIYIVSIFIHSRFIFRVRVG